MDHRKWHQTSIASYIMHVHALPAFTSGRQGTGLDCDEAAQAVFRSVSAITASQLGIGIGVVVAVTDRELLARKPLAGLDKGRYSRMCRYLLW